MNVKRVNNLPPNITAYFADATLVFPDNDHKRNFNLPLSSNVENWAKNINQNIIKPEVFLTTYLTVCKKSSNTDIENLLLYNLNNKKYLNEILKSNSLKKIIIQGMNKMFPYWPKSVVKPDLYCHYYFYGVFNSQEKYNDYLLYNCKFQNKFSLKYEDYKSLRDASSEKDAKENELKKIGNKYNRLLHSTPIVKLGKKFCLRIEINQDFPNSIDNDKGKNHSIKKLIDTIIIFANKLNIIEHPDTKKLVIKKNGYQYNPTDDLMYYCEIEKVDNEETKDNIIFYVCPICESNNENKDNYCCKEKRNNINNFPGFREGDEIEIVREEESINENQDEKEVPKKNNPNNFPGFKKEDEIVDKELNIANNINNQNNTWNCNARNNPECVIELFKKHIELFNDKNYTVDKKTVEKWLNECKNKNNCERQIKDIGTTLSDMVSLILNGNRTSLTSDIERVLDRPQKGRYRIDIDLLEKYEQSKK